MDKLVPGVELYLSMNGWQRNIYAISAIDIFVAFFVSMVVIKILNQFFGQKIKHRKRNRALGLIFFLAFSWFSIKSANTELNRKENLRRTVHDFSVLLIRAEVIQRQCQGVHLDALKPGETPSTEYAKWYTDIHESFKSHGLDSEDYHAQLEDVASEECYPCATCTSIENSHIFCQVKYRKATLSKIIEEFKEMGK